MLEIKPVQTKKEQEKICGLCGVAFDIDCLCYAAFESNKLLAAAQFRILGEYAVVYDLTNAAGVNDFQALIITGKCALNFIDLCKIKVKEVVFKIENQDLLEALGCKKDASGVWRVNLEGYFEAPCRKQL